MEKDTNYGQGENHRENYTAVSVDCLGQFCLLFVVEDCCHQNFDQREKDKQGAC
jgi:hypothetical protein